MDGAPLISNTCYKTHQFLKYLIDVRPNVINFSTCQKGAWDCDTDSCEDITCPKNQEYIDTESICQAKVTCATYDLKASCSDSITRFRGCGCKNGTVMAPDVSNY